MLATFVAAAAMQLVTIATPSANVDVRTAVVNEPRTQQLMANVLLPAGYDGRRRFPVLVLLHGVGDRYDTWARPDRGDIQRTAAGLGAIVVMPEGGRGFYTNWFRGGRRGDPGWERFYLDELIAQVERDFRVLPGRRHHAIAGLSMGGLGAAYLAGQRPDWFGTAVSLSGFVQHQRPEVAAGLRAVGGVEYRDIFGPQEGFYATGHNPTRLAENLRRTRVYVAVGDGTARPGVPATPATVLAGGAAEAGLRAQNEEFVPALREAGVDVTYRPGDGVHDWPYWREDLREAIDWGLFRGPAAEPDRWAYRTVAPVGRMWGLTFRFAAPPEQVVRFERTGDRLRATGAGDVLLRDVATGCTLTATLPFDRPLPGAAACGALRVRVTPRRVRPGRLARLRVRAVARRDDGRLEPAAGALVRVGRTRGWTDARGVAVVRHRFACARGLRRVRVSLPGLRAGAATLRVR